MCAKHIMNEVEAAEYTGLSRSTLRQSRMNGYRENRIPPPPWVQIGRSIRYLKDDLDEWLRCHRIEARPAAIIENQN